MKNSTYTGSGKILITVAGGKVGQHVVRQVAERKVSARAAFHSQSKASEVREAEIEVAVLEFDSPESIAAAFRELSVYRWGTLGSEP